MLLAQSSVQECCFFGESRRHTIDSCRGFSNEMVVQSCKHLSYISNAHSSASGRREAKLALELDVVGLLETEPLLVCEQGAEAAVAKSNGLVGTQLLRFECILSCPAEARADLVQAGGCVLEINTDPLLRGIGAGARVIVVEVLQP